MKAVSQTVTITGTTPATRTAIVDFATKCATCHGTLTVHGENRTLAMVDAKGNPGSQTDINLCASCHNPNATDILDITKSAQTSGACALSSSPVGAADHAIDFKTMIHAIHASGDPYAYNTTSPIYGTYGNGAGGAASGTGGLTICSSHAPGGGETFQVLIRPSSDENGVPSLANCEACHLSGTEYPVDPTTVQGTSIHANSATSDLTQATVATPNSAAAPPATPTFGRQPHAAERRQLQCQEERGWHAQYRLRRIPRDLFHMPWFGRCRGREGRAPCHELPANQTTAATP